MLRQKTNSTWKFRYARMHTYIYVYVGPSIGFKFIAVLPVITPILYLLVSVL